MTINITPEELIKIIETQRDLIIKLREKILN